MQGEASRLSSSRSRLSRIAYECTYTYIDVCTLLHLRELLSSNCVRSLDDNHTQNEVCLYNDLMAARAELERQKETIEQLEEEKREIVAVMHQAAVSLHYFRKLRS